MILCYENAHVNLALLGDILPCANTILLNSPFHRSIYIHGHDRNLSCIDLSV